MKAIIVAAGKGTRMYPLGITTPKLLTPIFNRPLIHNFVDILDGFVDEIVLVLDNGEFGKRIKAYIQSLTWPMKISFTMQEEQKGTGHALQMAKDLIPEGEKFLFMYGDDIYTRADIENVVKYEYAIVGKEVNDPEKWGILQQDKEGHLVKIIEKPETFVGNLANIGIFLLDTDMFAIYNETQPSPRGEMEITDGLTIFAQRKKMKVLAMIGKWIPVGYPWHILDAHDQLIETIDFQNEGTIQEGVYIHGRVKLGKGSIIKSGVYIDGDVIIGENTVIGPNAYLRGITVIGDNCKIGNGVEIKNSTLFTGTAVPHLSYIGDSILGHNVNFSGGSITANVRFDKTNVKTLIKGNLVDTGRRKFGTVIGDNAFLGIKTTIYPGRKIGPGMTTLPGEVIRDDKY